MSREIFDSRLKKLQAAHDSLLQRKNEKEELGNGIFDRYRYPVLTAEHTPLIWRYDMNYESNPWFMERMGINATFNAGAIEMNGKIYLVARVEGADRKSFFGTAVSNNGIDNFTFLDYPILMPETEEPDVNIYDIRLVRHEDGWIYGLFCTERKAKDAPPGDTSSADAQCGIARTKDLINWERLPDLKTPSNQQRNCVLHPEFVNGKYAIYTRPQDSFIDPGKGGGIGWGLLDDMTNPVIEEESVIERKAYHTIKEMKNGQGPAPIKTAKGWLHLAHGVRNTAAGLRYVLYMFLTDLNDPTKLLYSPGGYFMGPINDERIGDVSNVLFSNGWVKRENGEIFIYYASSDTRMHVATTTEAQLLDYVMNTPPDGGGAYRCTEQRIELIKKNLNR